jgi:hypothetical protein
MSHAHQIAPSPNQVEPIDLPDDGALVIETTGVEVLLECPPAVSTSASSNDNATNDSDAAAQARQVVSFVATLPRVG